MKQLTFAAAVVSVTFLGTFPAQAQDEDHPVAKVEYAIALHGGAGRERDDEQWRVASRSALEAALDQGARMLDQGAASLDVVEAVVRMLEDSEYFNAGRGAVFNAAGTHELDASIMDGRTRAAGGVAAVRTVRNPVSLARLVMERTRHVLLATDGAEQFADELDGHERIERVPNEFFSTPYRREQLEKVRQAEADAAEDAEGRDAARGDASMGTVGCVALDRHGNLAAATSTGGLVNKRFGRVGDSPIVGAGTFADNRTCAVSCTGTGEDFIRGSVAFDVSARCAYRGDSLEAAVRAILEDSEPKVRGGIIAVDRQGRITMQFNTAGMSRAAADSTGRREVYIGP